MTQTVYTTSSIYFYMLRLSKRNNSSKGLLIWNRARCLLYIGDTDAAENVGLSESKSPTEIKQILFLQTTRVSRFRSAVEQNRIPLWSSIPSCSKLWTQCYSLLWRKPYLSGEREALYSHIAVKPFQVLCCTSLRARRRWGSGRPRSIFVQSSLNAEVEGKDIHSGISYNFSSQVALMHHLLKKYGWLYTMMRQWSRCLDWIEEGELHHIWW